MSTSLPSGLSILGRLFLFLIIIGLPGYAFANDCTKYIISAETQYQIPRGMLMSIALVESGKKGKPYPWAVNVGGKTVYSQDRAAAEKRIKDKKGGLRRNAMVGCMQLSVFYHKKAFSQVGQMFKPEENVMYAARYLTKHYKRYGSWTTAIKRYHGGTRLQNRSYACKVRNRMESLELEDYKLVEVDRCKKRGRAFVAPDVLAAIDATKRQVVASAQ